MNRTFTVIFVLLATSGFAGKGASLNEISELKWHHRVVLVWSKDNVEYLKAIFNENQYEVDDRDIIWFIIHGDKVDTNFKGSISAGFVAKTNDRFSKKRGTVLLIGKDGGIKNLAESLNLEDLFKEIDRMPMRRIEMNEKTKE